MYKYCLKLILDYNIISVFNINHFNIVSSRYTNILNALRQVLNKTYLYKIIIINLIYFL